MLNCTNQKLWELTNLGILVFVEVEHDFQYFLSMPILINEKQIHQFNKGNSHLFIVLSIQSGNYSD